MNAEKILKIIKLNPKYFKIRPNNKLLFFKDWGSHESKINDIIDLLKKFNLSMENEQS